MGASEEPWFVARLGAQRRDKIIYLPLMCIGRDNLTDVEISVRDQKHVVGLSTEGGPAYDWIDEVGTLRPVTNSGSRSSSRTQRTG